MKEIWKNIPEYEGLYQVSNLGNVKSINRTIIQKHSSGCDAIHIYKEKEIYVRKGKYLSVTLWKNNKCQRKLIHKLVAETFLNWMDYKYTEKDYDKIICKKDLIVNHKDENKYNNKVDNLEWCTYSYNNRYGENTNGLNKKVYQFDINGYFIKEYKSISECARLNKFNNKTLNRHCHKEDIYKGYIWKLEKGGGLHE